MDTFKNLMFFQLYGAETAMNFVYLFWRYGIAKMSLSLLCLPCIMAMLGVTKDMIHLYERHTCRKCILCEESMKRHLLSKERCAQIV